MLFFLFFFTVAWTRPQKTFVSFNRNMWNKFFCGRAKVYPNIILKHDDGFCVWLSCSDLCTPDSSDSLTFSPPTGQRSSLLHGLHHRGHFFLWQGTNKKKKKSFSILERHWEFEFASTLVEANKWDIYWDKLLFFSSKAPTNLYFLELVS